MSYLITQDPPINLFDAVKERQMALPRMHDDREYCLYHNDLGQSVGECALEVRGWIADHPEYQGRIWGDWNTGGSRDQFDATEMFFETEEA